MRRLAVVSLLGVCGLAAVAGAESDKIIESVKALAGNCVSIDRSVAAIHINEDGTYDGSAATGAKVRKHMLVGKPFGYPAAAISC